MIGFDPQLLRNRDRVGCICFWHIHSKPGAHIEAPIRLTGIQVGLLDYEPQVLLLDEPFGALDAMTRERMGQELLRIWRARRKTVVMVTHSVTEAVFLADRVLVLGARPAIVVDEVAVDLPRPRTVAVTETSGFGAMAHRVRDALDRARV